MTLDPKYIPMFAKAESIQEGWKPRCGDWIMPDGEYAYPLLICESNPVNIAHTVEVSFPKSCHESTGRIRIDKAIFHPSVEWMAERWGEANPLSPPWDFIFHLYIWLNHGVGFHAPNDYPLQVIALHFLMDSLHNLKWSEKEGEWV